MMHPREAAIVSFDCYGTLIDWRRGASDAIGSIPSLANFDRETVISRRLEIELEVEHERYRPYNEVLAISIQRTAADFGVNVGDDESSIFARSIADWPAYSDAVGFLRRLATIGTPLAILSNVTRSGLQTSVRKLGAQFDEFVTAEDVHSYKPDHAHWRELFARRQIGPEQALHIAGSIAHDIRAATDLGVTTVWVRRHREPLPADIQPSLVVQSLAELGDYWRLPYSR